MSTNLPRELVVGRWWATRGQPCEVDVLGLIDGRVGLLGEARWQAAPLGIGEVNALREKLGHLPPASGRLQLALWGRGGVTSEAVRAGVRGFSLKDVLDFKER